MKLRAENESFIAAAESAAPVKNRRFGDAEERDKPRAGFSFAPLGLASTYFYPRLTPLREAQGKLWAAFYRRFAAVVALREQFSDFGNVPQGLKPTGQKRNFIAALKALRHPKACG